MEIKLAMTEKELILLQCVVFTPRMTGVTPKTGKAESFDIVGDVKWDKHPQMLQNF